MATQPHWWESAPLVSPANDPSFTGYIPGTPKQPTIPSGYEPDPDHPGSIRPIKGGPNDPTGGGSVGASDLNGDPYLATLDKPTASMVKALADGRKSFPSGAALRAPYWQNMLAHVGNYDPGFDETNYTTRSATRKDFSVGTAGKNIRALNTAIGHLGQLYGQIGGTASHGLVPLNYVENAISSATGSSGPTTYKSTTSALAGELTAVYRGSGGAEADIQRYISELSPNASEEQKKATIRNIAGLLNSRLEALQDQYQKGLGSAAKNYQFLDPHAQKVLGIINGGDAPPPPSEGSGGDNPSGGGSGGPPAVREVEQKGFGLTQPDEVPGAREYRAGLYSAMRSKKIKSYEDTVAFTDAFNQQHGTNLPPPMKDKGLSNAIAAAQQGKAFDIALPQHDARTLKLIEDMRKNDGAGTAFKHGARDAITLGAADEIRGGVEGFAGALRGEGSFSDIYAANRDAERYNDNALMTDHPRAYVGGQLVGGVALAPLAPIGEAGTLGALARTGAKSGAAYGALYGFNSGTDAESRLSGAGMGAATGATVGALSPYVATAAGKAVSPLIPRRFKAPLGMDPELAAASEAEGVDLIRPMVDPKAISDYGALESNVYSQPIIRGAAGRVRGQIEDRASALGADGTPLNTEAAGSLIQGAARRFIERSKTVANQLYNRARNLAGDATVTPRAALGQLRQELMALKETPNVNQGETEFLNELGDDLTKGPLSIDAIRGLRSSVRGRINQSGLTATQADARASRVLDALQQDVTAALPEGAATAYKRADAFYRERMVHIDDIIGRFLGKRDNPISGEQAFNRLKSMTSPGGDGRRLGGLMRGLTGDERQDIAATIAQSLGRRGADEPFSTALFISQTRKLSPSARRTIFGPDGAQSIDNLRLLSRKLEEAEKDINRSRSATVLERQGIRTAARAFISGLAGVGGTAVTGSISGGVAGVAAAGGAMGVSAARRVLSARAMVNPRVSRWMAEAADVSTPQQAKEATRKLSIIISREPALAHELQPVYDFLENRLELPLAANPDQGSEGNNE